MKVAALILVLLFSLALGQNCGIQGPFACTGGDILGIDFGDDDDDDFFEYYQTSDDRQCTLVQQGTYDISGSTVSVEFEIDDDECVITFADGADEDDCNIECVNSLQFTTSSDCGTISGPNGETCSPSNTCDDLFTCPGGEDPIDNPNNEPDANGCGPSAFPLTGPSFAFLECCEQHDFCYGTCGTSKIQCDNDFYECMFCNCDEEYDNFFGETVCEELACSYYQAVEEFGCFAFVGGQEDSCSCPNKKEGDVLETKEKSERPSKFGPVHPSLRETELFCDAPFDPQCDSSNNSPSSDNSPASNSRTSDTSNNSPSSDSSRTSNSRTSDTSNNSPSSDSSRTSNSRTSDTSNNSPSSDGNSLAVTFVFAVVILVL